MPETKKYFVFISYSSKDNEDDNKWAEWLRYELDHWHFPATYNNNGHKPVRDNLRKVFRDRDSFSAGEEWDKQAEAKLKDSQNLIVICSPNAAKSDAVNKEIEIFINQGKGDCIFPFIIGGNGPEEYFPPALKHNIVGGDVKKDGGRDKAFIKVVAGMLDVNFDDLYNRYELEKAEQARLEREKREKLQIAQSRFVAEKANQLVEEGDSYFARRILLEVLPHTNDASERPLVLEAESVFRHAYEKDNAVLRKHTDVVTAATFNNDAKLLISVSWDKCICVWDVKNGMLLEIIEGNSGGHLDRINAVCMNPIASTFATASDDNTILIWRPEYDAEGNLLKHVLVCPPLIHPDAVVEVSYSSDGKFIIAAIKNGEFWVWDNRGTFVSKVVIDTNGFYRIIGVSFDTSNKLFISTQAGLYVYNFKDGIIDLRSKECIYPYQGVKTNVHLSKDGSFAVSSFLNNVFVWDINSHERVSWNPPRYDNVSALDICSDCKHIAVGVEKQLYLLDYSHEKKLIKETKALKKFDSRITHLQYKKDDNLLCLSLENGEIRLMDFSEDVPKQVLEIAAVALDYSPKKDSFVVFGKESTLANIIKINSLSIIGHIGSHLHLDSVKDYFYLPHIIIARYNTEGTHLYTMDNRFKLSTWKINDYLLTKEIPIDEYNKTENDINRLIELLGKIKTPSFLDSPIEESKTDVVLALSRDGKRCVIQYKDAPMSLVDTRTLKDIKRLDCGHHFKMYCHAAFSYDNRLLVTTSDIECPKIWDAHTGDLICNLLVPPFYNENSVEFSFDGNKVISTSRNNFVNIWEWDKKTGISKLVLHSDEHHESVQFASFNRSGNLAVSASYNSIIVWDVPSGRTLRKIICPFAKTFVCFHPDETHIISADGFSVFIWDFPPLQKLIDDTRERFINNPLTEEERRHYYLE
jgi:WD40 repeat protein